jgi:multidrug efflux pump subunit AcrB
VFFALLATRMTFNVSSFMGLIMVIGIVAKNGILLLDADEKFRATGFPADEAIGRAGRRRLRPIVMAAMAAVAGMFAAGPRYRVADAPAARDCCYWRHPSRCCFRSS